MEDAREYSGHSEHRPMLADPRGPSRLRIEARDVDELVRPAPPIKYGVRLDRGGAFSQTLLSGLSCCWNTCVQRSGGAGNPRSF